MGRVPVTSENRTNEGGAGFPTLKLTEKGQKSRFTVLEDPWREYVHYVKCPKFGENGKVKKEKRTRRNGDTYEDIELELVGTHICLGDEDTLIEGGLDERNCPDCEASVKTGGDITGPVQRFSVNVAEYVTTPAGGIKKPFNASIKVWKFTGRIFDEIEGIKAEIGPLREHDLVLECEDPYWQRNKLSFKMEPGWKEAPKGYMNELTTTTGNMATDAQLKDACGREVSRSRMSDDVTYAAKQWRRYRNEGQDVPEEYSSSSADLAGGLDELLGEGKSASPGDPWGEKEPDPSAELGSTGSVDVLDPFSEFAGSSAKDEKQAAPAKDAASGSASGPPADTPTSPTDALPSEEKQGAFDFDNLLDGI